MQTVQLFGEDSARPTDNHTAIIEFKVDEVDGDSDADYGDGKAHDGCPRGGVPICIYGVFHEGEGTSGPERNQTASNPAWSMPTCVRPTLSTRVACLTAA